MRATRNSWAACAVAVLITLVGCGGGEKPEDFARKFYETLAAGRVDAVVNMFALDGVPSENRTAARGKVTMILGEMESRIKRGGGLAAVETRSTPASEDQATVQVRLRLRNGEQISEQLPLVRVRGDWKVKLQ